jgi:hypothetical protein
MDRKSKQAVQMYLFDEFVSGLRDREEKDEPRMAKQRSMAALLETQSKDVKPQAKTKAMSRQSKQKILGTFLLPSFGSVTCPRNHWRR